MRPASLHLNKYKFGSKTGEIIILPTLSYTLILLNIQTMAEAPEYEEEHQLIGEEYKIWKKHVPFLYWTASTYQLPTCTQTVEWLDDVSYTDNSQSHFCLVGTNSSGNNKIYLLRIEMPTDETFCDNSEFKYDAKVGEFGLKQMVIQRQIQRSSEINKVRIKPKSKLMAVKCGNNPNISILDLDNKSNFQEPGIVLEGHTAQGMGLEWNTTNTNYVASGSADRKICVWDVEAGVQDNGNTKPIAEYIFHSMGVEDVTWNATNPDILASCSQDRLIAIWDLRQKKKKPEIQKAAHSSDVFSVKFSPFSQTLLLSGGDDSEIALWDIRYFNKRIHTFAGHVQGVNCLKWSPTNRARFISGSSDRSIIMWNLQCAGTENQILFIHGGHQSRVLDLDFNRNLQNTVLSSQECNLLQVWCPSETALHYPASESSVKASEE